MGRTTSAVPYTYLKRGVYYFVIAAFGGVTLSGCQTTMPKPNGMAESALTEFLKASAPSSVDEPLITTLPQPGKVSVDATSRRTYIDGKNICAATDIDRT